MVTPVMRNLRDKDIVKASKLFGIDEQVLTRMNAQHLLDADYIRTLLIKSDYEYLSRGLQYLIDQKGAYTYPEILAALKKEYGIEIKELQAIIYGRRNVTMFFCRRCGIRITKSVFNRTGGLCSNCFAETLSL